MCKGGGYGVLGLRRINTCRKVPLQVNFFRWRHFLLPAMNLLFLHWLVISELFISIRNINNNFNSEAIKKVSKLNVLFVTNFDRLWMVNNGKIFREIIYKRKLPDFFSLAAS
jgi:hypothetical protein